MTTAERVDAEAGLGLEGFHPPRQTRSRETLGRLAGAVESLVLETGSTDLSVRDMIERAGTSVGAFYARFDNRDVALAYTSEAFWERSRALWSGYLAADRWEGTAAAAVLASVVRTFTRVMLADAERMRAFVSLSLATAGERSLCRVRAHDRFISRAVAGRIVAAPGEIRHPSPRRAAEEGFRRVLAAVRDHVVYEVEWGGAYRTTEACAFILSVVQMYGRYLDVHPVPESYGQLLRMIGRGHQVLVDIESDPVNRRGR